MPTVLVQSRSRQTVDWQNPGTVRLRRRATGHVLKWPATAELQTTHLETTRSEKPRLAKGQPIAAKEVIASAVDTSHEAEL